MRIDILTIFPEFFTSPLQTGIMKKMLDRGLVNLHITNIRDYSRGRHRVVDDYSYGGGPGMVMKPGPIFRAVEHAIEAGQELQNRDIIYVTPQGKLLDQSVLDDLLKKDHLIFISGNYQGIDERVRENLVTREISIGNYVLTGGELACLVIINAMLRLMPGAIGNPESVREDSFYQGILGYPVYSRPANFRGMKVPEVLLSGNHEKIRDFRRKAALIRTKKMRPELLDRLELSEKEKEWLREAKS